MTTNEPMQVILEASMRTLQGLAARLEEEGIEYELGRPASSGRG